MALCSNSGGNLQLFSSGVAPVPPADDIKKESYGALGDGPKSSCGCPGRDGIANAAARVCPAVVNLSVRRVSCRRVVRPWLGLKTIDLNEMIIAQLKERDASFPNVDRGVLVPMVIPGSPADRAGFHPGDVVIEFDGKPVERIKEIAEIMGDRIGASLKVVVKRAGDVLATLTIIPEEANPDMLS